MRQLQPPRTVLVLSLFAMMAACGGGDDESDDDSGPDDAEVAGIYRGTATPDGGTGSSATLIALADGRFVLVSNVALFKGTGSTSGNALSATATGFAPPGTAFSGGASSASFAFTGTATEDVEVVGSYTGGGISGRFDLDFNTILSGRPAALSSVQGNYNLPPSPGVTATLSVSGTGALTLTASNGCNGSGSIRVENLAGNTYSWSMTLSGCTANNGLVDGLGYMDGANILVLAGASTSAGWVAVATRI